MVVLLKSHSGTGNLTCRGDAVGTQGQEQEAGCYGCGACHVLGSKTGVQEEMDWVQWAWFLAGHPNLLLPFIEEARRKHALV